MDENAVAVGAFTKTMDKLTGGMYSQIKSVAASAKGWKSFNLILKASPLFLLAGVVGALVAAFKRLNGPMSQLQNILGGLDGVLNVVLDRIALLGDAILKIVSGDVSGAMESFRNSWAILDRRTSV